MLDSVDRTGSIVATDLEGTLSEGVYWKGFVRYLKTHGLGRRFYGFYLRLLPAWLWTKWGGGDMVRFKDEWLVRAPAMLRGFDQGRIDEMAEWVVEHELWPKRRQRVIAELETLRRQGHRILLVSGVHQPTLAAFAARMGAEALGTALCVQDGRVETVLPINTGEAKVRRLAEMVGVQSVVTAYGDTVADIPMLGMSLAPVAVCPDEPLRAEALNRGWRILDG